MRKNLVARVGMFVMTCVLSSTLALSNPVKAMAAEPTATETVTDNESSDNTEASESSDNTEASESSDKAEASESSDKAEASESSDKAEASESSDKAEASESSDKAEASESSDKAEASESGSGIVGNADKTAGFSFDFGNNDVTTEVEVKPEQDQKQEEEVGENPSDEPEDVTIPEDQTVQPTESIPTPAPTSEPEATTTSDNKEDPVIENPEEKPAEPTVEEHKGDEPKLVPQQQTEPQKTVEETKEEPKKDTPAPTVSETEKAPAPAPTPVKVVEDKKDKGDEPKNDVPTVNDEPAPKKVSGGNGGGRSSKKVTPVVIIKEEPTPAPELVVIPDAIPEAIAEETQDVFVPDTMPKAVPKTGDCSPIAVYAMIFFGSLIALAVFLLGAICGAARVLVSSHVVCDINGNKEAAAVSILFEQVEDALVRNNRHVRNVNEARIHLAMNSVRKALGLERGQRNVTFDWCDEENTIPSASVAAEHSANQLFLNGIRSNAVE